MLCGEKSAGATSAARGHGATITADEGFGGEAEGYLEAPPVPVGRAPAGVAEQVHPASSPAEADDGGPSLLIADSETLVRQAIAAAFAQDGRWRVAAEARDADELIDLIHAHRPSVVIADSRLPGLHDEDDIARIAQASPRTRLVLFTHLASAAAVTRAVEAGASGYVLKTDPFDRLLSAVEAAAEGRHYVTPRLGAVAERVARKGMSDSLQLTDKETAVLRSIASGYSTKEIAAGLGVTSKTVDAHRRRLMDKLGLASIAEITRFAIREGMIALESPESDIGPVDASGEDSLRLIQ